MTVVYEHIYADKQSRLLFLCKGAMESVVDRCTEFLDETGSVVPLTEGTLRFI